MRTRLILATSWLAADPNRTRAIGLGALIALALVSGLLPQELALAGNAPGGSHR